jgi:hypothetical protein
VKGGDREKGFYSIGGALRYFLEDEIDVTRKDDMRERILQGPPFSDQERRDILDYCEDELRHQWQNMRLGLVTELDRPFCYCLVVPGGLEAASTRPRMTV